MVVLLCFFCFELIAAYDNLVILANVSQSDTRDGGYPDKAVDGIVDGRFAVKSVTATGSEGLEAWWKLEFPEPYWVSKIRVWNRVDNGFINNWNGATVEIYTRDYRAMNDWGWAKIGILHSARGNPNEIQVNGYVHRLLIRNARGAKFLSLAEVQVFGDLACLTCPNENIVMAGNVSQSDTNGHGYPERAVDGITDGRYRTYTHTESVGSNAWWKIEFPEAYFVSKIRVWNRISGHKHDNSPLWWNGATVSIFTRDYRGLHDWGWAKIGILHYNHGNPNEIEVNAKVLRLLIRNAPGPNYLSLAEVEVFGHIAGSPTNSPTFALPTAMPTNLPTCNARRLWTRRTARNNCAANRFPSKKFGVEACKRQYQTKLEVSLANQLYAVCDSRCVYDYDRIIEGKRGGFIYNERTTCYRYVKKGYCFKVRKVGNAYSEAKNLAIELC